MKARMCEQTFGRTNMHADRRTDRRTDGLKHTPSHTCACKHTNAHIDERTHVRSNIWTHEHARGQTDRQTNGRTNKHWDARTCTRRDRHDIHTHVRTEANTQVHTWKLEFGSKKLEVRSKKCRACIDERTHVRTNIWTHEHARGQTDRQTDGWTQT